MTEPTATINERLALWLGWTYAVHEDWLALETWISPDGINSETDDPPDFCGEWAHAGPLQIELIRKKFAEFEEQDDGRWRVYWRENIKGPGGTHAGITNFEYHGNTLTEAIARACDAWMSESREEDQ